MRALLLVLICIVALSPVAVAQSKLSLRVGAKIPTKYLPSEDEDTNYVATHPSQFRPFIERTIAGVKYTIAFDEDTHRIKYIHTTDRAFRTAHGLRVGSQITVARKQITGGFGGWYTCAGRTSEGWDIIVADLSDWKEGATRMVVIGGFKKGGN